ncbi:ATP-binding cassette domain-containing protein [Streptomyces sp. SID6673]|nr:ATP-binding cassette domain-containing protein [Streptomyces sp. SID11726]NEB25062.1 ATP-binding cassette domain-containing protein [Streptomyces sp. SID6673]
MIDATDHTDDTDTDTGATGDAHALRLMGVRKTYRSGLFGRGPRVHALDGLDLTVPTGTVHALLGPNGAGKTTTVRTVATLLRPDEGEVEVCGLDAVAEPDAVRARIGVSGQYAAVDGTLTGFENLRLVGQLYKQSRGEASDRARELIADLALEDAADRPMRTYSGGMRRRLDLAGALINRPELIILDEPTTGLDPRGRRQIWEVIETQVAAGTTVLLTTQYLEEADALADAITVIDHGRVRAQGTADELKSTTAQSLLTIEVRDTDDSDERSGLVATTLAEVGLGMPSRLGPNRWSVPVADGTRSGVDAVKICDRAGIDVVDAEVTTPTLDDVFLRLTGRPEDDDPDAGQARARTERLERV